jgi:Na+-driven multidrug efflux pump
MSIVSFLLSLIFGGIAMYFSYQVGQRYQAGDQKGAERASTLAKVWGVVGIVVGGLILIAWRG